MIWSLVLRPIVAFEVYPEVGLVVAEVGNVIVGIAATVTGLYPSTLEALNVCSDVEGVMLKD